jgi:hypothetical protein
LRKYILLLWQLDREYKIFLTIKKQT